PRGREDRIRRRRRPRHQQRRGQQAPPPHLPRRLDPRRLTIPSTNETLRLPPPGQPFSFLPFQGPFVSYLPYVPCLPRNPSVLPAPSLRQVASPNKSRGSLRVGFHNVPL